MKKQKESNNNTGGINLCVADLKTFDFSVEEKLAISRPNKVNAVQLNCLLHQYCGRPLENGHLCKPLPSQ